EAADVAMTGYVLARDAWGQGYATEALQAMIELARQLGLRRLYALCHVEHVASRRVLEKCGLRAQSTLQNPFPNLPPDARREALRYELEFTATAQP
ncbi:MAG TPA: GNAT family N-acetyltransferase, partial [Povalibacter sp.]|nr:GNAT family N-acetyltransferase [Povalibacter sp.]